MCTSFLRFFKKNFEINKLSNYALQKILLPLSKISLHYQTVIDQRVTVLHQLFSWTLVGPLKYPVTKTIGLQDHLTVRAVP